MNRALLILVLSAWLLSACNFTLAADVTPPPGYQNEPLLQQTEPAVALEGSLFPLVPPNPADGAPIYAEKCAPCHGPNGLGDGPSAAQLPNPVPALGAPEVAREAVPAAWFRMVTVGNLERFMPGFSSLSDRERWDVTAYALSLSVPQSSLEQGAALYQANCAECHGDSGQGDGPQAAALSQPLPDFTNQEFMAQKSTTDFFTAITEGIPPEMPAFGDALSESDRWMMSEYVRSLTFTGPRLAQAGTTPVPGEGAPEEAAATPSPLASPDSTVAVTETVTSTESVTSTLAGVITGTVINQSGGAVPAGMEVFLHGFDQMQMVITQTTQVERDGTYTFDQVEMPEGRVFLTTVEFDGATYGSEIGQVEPGVSQLNMPISVYETTTDASILSADRLHLFFEFIDPQTVQVIELFIISNPTTQTLVAPATGEPTLTFQLPEGAANLQFQDGQLGERYLETPGGFGDTVPVRPGMGAYQVVFAFEMPYERSLELVQPLKMPVQSVVILVPEDSIKVRAENLEDGGVRPVEDMQYHMYNINGLEAGEDLQVSLSGRPSVGGPGLSAGTSSEILIGLGALGVVLIVAGVWLYRRNQADAGEIEEEAEPAPEPASVEDSETLMDAILALDDLYQAGEIPEEAYRARRALLKERLEEALKNEQ